MNWRSILLAAAVALSLGAPLAHAQGVPTGGVVQASGNCPTIAVLNPGTGRMVYATSAGALCTAAPYSHHARYTLTFTENQSTGYAAGANIGDLLQFPVSATAPAGCNAAPGVYVLVRLVTVAWTAGTSSAQGGINVQVFDTAPTSTIADGSATTWAATDAPFFSFGMGMNTTATAVTQTDLFYSSNTAATGIGIDRIVTVDANGKINVVFTAAAAITYATPSASATAKLEILC